jgi:uncharacterized protein YjbJ (UPF0337 family)
LGSRLTWRHNQTIHYYLCLYLADEAAYRFRCETARPDDQFARASGWGYLRHTTNGRSVMSNADDMKGRAKEAAGALTGDDDLRREGKLDQASGKAKEAVDTAKNKVKEMLGHHDDKE